MDIIKRYKRIIAVMGIVFLVVIIEVVANYPAIKAGYDNLDISKNINVLKKDAKEKYQIVFKSEEILYVREIRLQGEFSKEHIYTISTKEINEFGKIEKEKYSDTVNSFFSDFHTNLGKKVKSIKITMEKSEGEELTGVFLSNRFEINKYRMIFAFISLLLLYCAFFERVFIKKAEWYFVGVSLMFGLLIISLAQTTCVSWDEQIHFQRVYELSGGKNTRWSEAAKLIVDRTNLKCNTKAEFAQLRSYMDEKGEEYILEKRREVPSFSYQEVAYLPMALFFSLGKGLGLSFSSLFSFGKLGNLFTYIFVMFWAIRLAKSRKMFVAFIAMMPTTLLQASSYTYDGVVFSFLTLGCVLWCREKFFESEKYHTLSVIGAIIFFAAGSLAKAIYIPLVLLLLLLPQPGTRSRKEKILFRAGIVIVFTLVMMTFVLPTVSNTMARNLSYGGDARGGDTSVVRQIMSMVKNPWASIKLMIGNVLALDNFRNLGSMESANFFFGNLMFLNFSSWGTLGDKWCLLLLPILTILILCQETGSSQILKCRLREKIWMWGILLVTVFLIWGAMYLSFTPVGATVIAGVQARYYLPLLYFGVLLLTNTKIQIQISQLCLSRLTYSSICILQIVAIWQLAFKARIM